MGKPGLSALSFYIHCPDCSASPPAPPSDPNHFLYLLLDLSQPNFFQKTSLSYKLNSLSTLHSLCSSYSLNLHLKCGFSNGFLFTLHHFQFPTQKNGLLQSRVEIFCFHCLPLHPDHASWALSSNCAICTFVMCYSKSQPKGIGLNFGKMYGSCNFSTGSVKEIRILEDLLEKTGYILGLCGNSTKRQNVLHPTENEGSPVSLNRAFLFRNLLRNNLYKAFNTN